MNQHVTISPALDAATAVLPPDETPRTPQDWEQLVSPGHVLRERLTYRTGRRYLRAWLAAGVCLVVAMAGPGLLNIELDPELPRRMLVDPNTAATIDGEKVPYYLDFIADLTPQAGLSPDVYAKLVDAVTADVSGFGPVDPAAWEATAALPTAPRITSPGKVFQEEGIDRLGSSGVVSIDRKTGMVDVVAFVDGRFSWTMIDGRQCARVAGPEVPSCERFQTSNPNVVERMRKLRPAKPEAQAEPAQATPQAPAQEAQ